MIEQGGPQFLDPRIAYNRFAESTQPLSSSSSSSSSASGMAVNRTIPGSGTAFGILGGFSSKQFCKSRKSSAFCQGETLWIALMQFSNLDYPSSF
jgi:hypothetical protein